MIQRSNILLVLYLELIPRPQDKFVYTDLSEMFRRYKFENGKSTYMGIETGEGGYVYAEPGNVYKCSSIGCCVNASKQHYSTKFIWPIYKKFKELMMLA